MKSYPAYKESGIEWLGAVPADWTVGNIRRFATMKTGHTPSRTNEDYWQDCTIPWFTLADVWQLRDGTRTYLGDTAQQLSELGLANSAAELLPVGTVVLSRTASVGFSGIMPTPMATSQDFWNWICGPRMLPEFLLYQFRAMTQQFRLMVQGSTHKTIYQGIAAGIVVVVPPLNVQRAIVDHLDRETSQIDELIAEQEALLKLLVERRLATISRSVSRQSSGSVPLKHCVTVRDCKHVTAEFVDDGLPLASIGQVGERMVNLASAQRTTRDFFESLREDGRAPKPGDLVMTRNATVGAVAMVPDGIEPFALGQDVCLLSPSAEMETRFVYYALKSGSAADQVASMGVGTTFRRINVETIRNLRIPVHDRGEQLRVADALDRQTEAIDNLVGGCRELIALLKERRAALITAAVTGKIDVRAS